MKDLSGNIQLLLFILLRPDGGGFVEDVEKGMILFAVKHVILMMTGVDCRRIVFVPSLFIGVLSRSRSSGRTGSNQGSRRWHPSGHLPRGVNGRRGIAEHVWHCGGHHVDFAVGGESLTS